MTMTLASRIKSAATVTPRSGLFAAIADAVRDGRALPAEYSCEILDVNPEDLAACMRGADFRARLSPEMFSSPAAAAWEKKPYYLAAKIGAAAKARYAQPGCVAVSDELHRYRERLVSELSPEAARLLRHIWSFRLPPGALWDACTGWSAVSFTTSRDNLRLVPYPIRPGQARAQLVAVVPVEKLSRGVVVSRMTAIYQDGDFSIHGDGTATINWSQYTHDLWRPIGGRFSRHANSSQDNAVAAMDAIERAALSDAPAAYGYSLPQVLIRLPQDGNIPIRTAFDGECAVGGFTPFFARAILAKFALFNKCNRDKEAVLEYLADGPTTPADTEWVDRLAAAELGDVVSLEAFTEKVGSRETDAFLASVWMAELFEFKPETGTVGMFMPAELVRSDAESGSPLNYGDPLLWFCQEHSGRQVYRGDGRTTFDETLGAVQAFRTR